MEPFLPPGELKDLRRSLWTALEPLWQEAKQAHLFHHTQDPVEKGLKSWADPPPSAGEVFTNLAEGGIEGEEGFRWVFLNPLVFGKKAQNQVGETLRDLVHNNARQGVKTLVGINNLGHLALLKTARKEGWREVVWFGDYGLYGANKYLSLWLKTNYPEMQAITPWVERPEALERSALPTVPWSQGRPLPLFISRVCWRRHALGRSCRGCPGNFEEVITQGKSQFLVQGRNCLTFMLRY